MQADQRVGQGPECSVVSANNGFIWRVVKATGIRASIARLTLSGARRAELSGPATNSPASPPIPPAHPIMAATARRMLAAQNGEAVYLHRDMSTGRCS